MKHATITLALLLSVFFKGAYAMEIKNEFKLVNTIPGEQVNLIKIALAEIESRNIEIQKYEVSFFESPTSWILLFKYIDTPPGLRGSVPGSPSYEVEISKQDSTVIRSNAIR